MDIDLPSNHATLLILGKKVASHHVKYLQEIYSATQLHSYYEEKYKWSPQIMQYLVGSSWIGNTRIWTRCKNFVTKIYTL
jgi:hypothetical protein